VANQEALIAEYSALRQEILQVDQQQMQFVGAALAVASAFVVYGFQAQNSFAFLAASIILLAGMYIGARGTSHVVLVGTYLYAIVEPKVEGLKWETMLAKIPKMKFRFSLRYLIVSIYALYPLVCVFFAWLFIHNYRILNVLLYSCITVILGVFLILVSVYSLHISSNKYQSDCVSRWKKIEEEINPTVAAIHADS